MSAQGSGSIDTWSSCDIQESFIARLAGSWGASDGAEDGDGPNYDVLSKPCLGDNGQHLCLLNNSFLCLYGRRCGTKINFKERELRNGVR